MESRVSRGSNSMQKSNMAYGLASKLWLAETGFGLVWIEPQKGSRSTNDFRDKQAFLCINKAVNDIYFFSCCAFLSSSARVPKLGSAGNARQTLISCPGQDLRQFSHAATLQQGTMINSTLGNCWIENPMYGFPVPAGFLKIFSVLYWY